MPPKRKLSEMTAPELSEEPPAMSTRSKRAKTVAPSNPQQQSITKSIETEESNDTKTAYVTKKRATKSKKKVVVASEQSIPTPSLTPSPIPPKVEQPLPPKKKMTQKRNTAKSVLPHSKISQPDATLADAPTSSPDSTPPQSQQQQNESRKGTRKRTATKAFSTLSTNLDSEITMAPSLTSSPAEQKQQPRTKKQKMTQGRTNANPVPPQSASPESTIVPAADAPPVVTEQQEPRITKQKTTRNRKAAEKVSSNAAIQNSDQNLAPAPATVQSKQQKARKSKQQTTQKRATEAVPVSPPIASAEIEDITLLSPAERVAKFWMDKCRKVFPEKDGFEVTIHALGDTGNQSKQQVFVWEKEYYDEALLTRPSSNIPESRYDIGDVFKLPEPSRMNTDGTRSWTEKDCDFLALGTVQPPATMKEYELAAKSLKSEFEERDVPILVIECRGAEADGHWEWRNPSQTGLSRSYSQSPESKIQKALIAQIYTFDDIKVKYEPAKGWLTQEQCFCATAIGDKIKFWKHVSPYPHLKQWSGTLDRKVDEELFDELVGEMLDEVKEDGFEFAMEWDGRKNFTLA